MMAELPFQESDPVAKGDIAALLEVETLTVGPEGDIPFTSGPYRGPLMDVGFTAGAPDLENGWEGNGERSNYFEGQAFPNEEGEGQRVFLQVDVHAAVPNTDTIFTLPVGYRPLKKVEISNVVIELDGSVHWKEDDDAGSESLEFDSEWAGPAATLFTGIDVTVTKDAFGNVSFHGFAAYVEGDESLPLFVLPEGFRPSQPVVGEANGYVGSEIRPDGSVHTQRMSNTEGIPNGVEETPTGEFFLFATIPTFKAAS